MLSAFKKSTLIHTFLFGAYLVSGLILNALQAVIYVAVKPFNKNLFRKINRHLIYGNWAQIVSLAQCWSGSRVRVWCDDETTRDSFAKDHGLVIMNHTYEIDFVFCWLVCDSLGVLSNCKTTAKKMIAYVPVMGWNWFFGEMIFLERNWEKDREQLPKKLDNLLTFDQAMLLLMFSEGTRFSAKKHEASLKFAKEKNLPILKYHLLPRPKGFVFCAKHFQGKVNYIYDIELCIPKDATNKPSFTSLLQGKPVYADMYIRRHAIDKLPKDDEGLKKFLYQMYEGKDKLADYYHTHGNKFPEGCVELPVPPRALPGLIHLGMFSAFTIPMIYWALNAFWFSPSILQMVTITTIFGGVYASLLKMVGLTEISKSSEYGAQDDKKTR